MLDRITARNYAAQAEQGLAETAAQMPARDAAEVAKMCDKIGRAVHFVVPDGGGIFDDKGKGIAGQELRLPFPLLTIEYYCIDHDIEHGLVQMPKRIIIAEEMTADEMRSLTRRGNKNINPFTDDERYIFITWAATSERYGGWVPGACGLAIPAHWDRGVSDPTRKNYESLTGNRDVTRLAGVPVVIMDGLAERYLQFTESVDVAMRHMVHDVSTEAGVLIEFCEALSCTNVGMAVTQDALAPAKAARRARDGKLPIYETRMLVIKPGASAAGRTSNVDAGGRSSPAQHLRRGHVRRLPTGKNVWVQSCVVGSDRDGFVDKTYAVRM